jgi:hypothetical protein
MHNRQINNPWRSLAPPRFGVRPFAHSPVLPLAPSIPPLPPPSTVPNFQTNPPQLCQLRPSFHHAHHGAPSLRAGLSRACRAGAKRTHRNPLPWRPRRLGGPPFRPPMQNLQNEPTGHSVPPARTCHNLPKSATRSLDLQNEPTGSCRKGRFWNNPGVRRIRNPRTGQTRMSAPPELAARIRHGD